MYTMNLKGSMRYLYQVYLIHFTLFWFVKLFIATITSMLYDFLIFISQICRFPKWGDTRIHFNTIFFISVFFPNESQKKIFDLPKPDKSFHYWSKLNLIPSLSDQFWLLAYIFSNRFPFSILVTNNLLYFYNKSTTHIWFFGILYRF